MAICKYIHFGAKVWVADIKVAVAYSCVILEGTDTHRNCGVDRATQLSTRPQLHFTEKKDECKCAI